MGEVVDSRRGKASETPREQTVSSPPTFWESLGEPSRAHFAAIAEELSLVCGARAVFVAVCENERQRLIAAHGLSLTDAPLEFACSDRVLASAGVFQARHVLMPAGALATGAMDGRVEPVALIGRALVLADGRRVGVLCVLAEATRSWTAREIACLERLALVATGLIQLEADLLRFNAWQTLGLLPARQAEIAFATMEEGVILQDREGVILRHNASAARLLGLSEEALLGRASRDPSWELIDEAGDTLTADDQPSMKCLRTAAPVVAQCVGVRLPDGALRWLQINSHPVFADGDVRPVQTVTTFSDQTEFRRQARRLEDALAELQAASKAKSDFLADFSHEIRTPLNGVLAMASALAIEPASERQREMLDVLARAGRQLERQLTDILDLAKVEARQVELSIAPIDLAREMRALAEMFRARAEQKEIAFHIDCDADAERAGPVLGDVVRIRQIVGNLLSNAVKFTDAGAVTLTLRVRPSERPRFTTATIQVADTGIGMDAPARDGLFRRFRQADATIFQRFGGTGLGLSISQGLARLMQARLEVESAPGQGATFTLVLELAEGGAPVEAPPVYASALNLSGRRLLLADDHPINRKVIELLLEPTGGSVASVADGQAAVAEFRASAFEVVMMDMHMPHLDGVAATREIREIEAAERRPRSFVVMLSGDTSSERHKDAIDAGVDVFLPKPVDPLALYSCLLEVAAE